MPYPDPKQSLVIQYNYLWHEQSEAGRDYAKDRPCIVVGVNSASDREKPRVYVLPITTQAQADNTAALEIPASVQRQAGLPEKSWVVTDQGNAFDWPSENVRPVPKGPKRGEWAYGYMSSGFYRSVHEQMNQNIERSRFRGVTRPDDK